MTKIIKHWQADGFKLDLYETSGIPFGGRVRYPYKFYDQDKVIFEGQGFSPSPMFAADSLDSVFALLSYFALQEGDTDSEYFQDYTREQIAWRDSGRAEELSYFVYDFEEEQD